MKGLLLQLQLVPAANGVVIITTKKNRRDAPVSVQYQRHFFDMAACSIPIPRITIQVVIQPSWGSDIKVVPTMQTISSKQCPLYYQLALSLSMGSQTMQTYFSMLILTAGVVEGNDLVET